jgi:signal transduction histidine kinase
MSTPSTRTTPSLAASKPTARRRALARATRSLEDAVQFERLLARLSTQFISLPPAAIDGAIENALQQLVEALDLDRSTITRYGPHGEVSILHSWARSGLVPTPTGDATFEFPWVIERIRRGETIAFSSVDELPPEASVDKGSFQRILQRSHVSIPLRVGEEIVGALAVGTLRHARRWPDELLGWLRRVGEVFGNALARKQSREELDELLGFERLVGDVLAALLSADPGNEDLVIESGLQHIGQYLHVEGATLWERIPDRIMFRKTHRWLAEYTLPPPDQVGSPELPWISAQLVGGSVVRLDRHAELPPEAEEDLRFLMLLGVRSLLAVPISVAGEVAGALSFASAGAERTWPKALLPRITILADVYGGVHSRRVAQQRKRLAEADTAQFRERLAHLVRVHTMGEMSAAIAHEINQPLMAIENYALAARRRATGSSESQKVTELLDKVIAQTARAGDIVRRLRTMVKRHDIQTSTISVERLVAECIDMVQTDCELRDIRLERRLASPLPLVVADGIQIQQVVLNLLRNAIEAMEAAHVDVPKLITIETALTEEKEISVRVTDRGPGIPEVDLDRVFEAFYSTKSSGLGIGLSISRKLIEAHGGMLVARNNPGGGAVFQFTLPVADSARVGGT